MISASQLHGMPTNREQEYLEGWQRARAELDNIRKRMLAEQGHQRQHMRAEMGQALLEVADSFYAVLQHLPPKLHDNSWAQGVLHVSRQFERLLQNYDITPINTVDEKFNPTLHEALAKVRVKDTESGHVVEIMQPGYKMRDIVLRPAKVKVTE